MQRRVYSILALLLLCTMPALARDSLRILIRKNYVVTPETQIQTAHADSLYTRFREFLELSESLHLVPLNEIQQRMDDVLPANFRLAYPSLLLLELDDAYQIDLFLYFTIQPHDKNYSLTLHAVEFPSAVSVATVSLPLPLKPQKKFDIQPFVTWLETLKAPGPFGYPFQPRDTGLTIVTNSLYHPSLQEQLSAFDDDAPRRPENLYLKVIKTDADFQSFCTKGQSIQKQLRADAVLFSLETESSVLISPTETLRQHARDIELPRWPALPRFSCLPVRPDSLFFADFLQTFQPRHLDAQRLRAFRSRGSSQNSSALLLNTVRQLQPYLQTHSPAPVLHNEMHNAYSDLIRGFLDHEREFGWINLNYGAYCEQQNELNRAISLYKSAELTFSENRSRLEQLISVLHRARLHQRLRQWQDAQAAYLSAIRLAENQHDDVTLAGLHHELGNVYIKLDEPLDAWLHWEDAATLYLARQDSLTAARLYIQMGTLAIDQGFSNSAIDFLQTGRTLAKQLQQRPLVAESNRKLGRAAEANADPNLAIRFYHQAIDELEKLQDFKDIAYIDQRLGGLYRQVEDFQAAKQHLNFALKQAEEHNQDSLAVQLYMQLGEVAMQRRHWSRAHRYFSRARETADFIGDQRILISSYYKSGLALIEDGRFEKGLEQIRLAKLLSNQLSDEMIDENQQLLLDIQNALDELESTP